MESGASGDAVIAGGRVLPAPSARRRWVVGLAVAGAALVAAAGFWYAHARGWLDPAYRWVRQLGGGEAKSSGGADMPGMDMGSMGGGEEVAPGRAAVTIPSELRQRIGVTTGRVERAPLTMSVRTVGIVRPDETRAARIHLRTEGWVESLSVNYTGQSVKKGDPLLSIYSPQFLTTQQEFLNARKAGQTDLAELSRQRLELWGVPAAVIDEVARAGKPRRNLTLASPLSGTVLEKDVLEKEYVTPQKQLYVIADLSTVWVQAKVYEYELPHVELGMPAAVTLPALPGKKLAGKVVFVEPTVEEKTRTARVRVELPNPDGALKPGMFAHIEIQHAMGDGLLVPATAVIRTGERDVVFRVEAEGRFLPAVVKVSPVRFGDKFHVLEGLKEGERVVTSANFLIDSESRLRLGGGMMNMPGMDMGDMKGMDMKGPGKDGMKGMDHSKMKH